MVLKFDQGEAQLSQPPEARQAAPGRTRPSEEAYSRSDLKYDMQTGLIELVPSLGQVMVRSTARGSRRLWSRT